MKTSLAVLLALSALCIQSLAQPRCLPSCIVSRWPGNNNPDDIISGYDATLQNGATYAAGWVCEAFSFDGGDDYALIGDFAALRFTNAITLEAWVYPTNRAVASGIISKWGAAGINQRAYSYFINSSGYLVLHVSADGTHLNTGTVTSTNTVPLNQWSHVVGTYDGNSLRVYINGVLRGVQAYISGIHPGNMNFIIGSSLAGGSYFAGKIDEATAYGCALTAAQINSNYEAQKAGGCPTCVTAAACTVSWWTGDSVTTDIVNGNNGTLQNGATYAPGRVCNAFSFDGVDDYVQVADTASLRMTNRLTVEAWIYPTNISAAVNQIVAKWGSTGLNQRAYSFAMHNSGLAYLHVSSDGGFVNTGTVWSTSTIPLNQWTHIAGVYDGSNLKLYVNGQLEGTQSYNLGIFPGNMDLIIGSSQVANSYFPGLIDEPTVYNCALSAGDIDAIYDAGSSGKCNN